MAEFLPSYHRGRATRWEVWLSSQLGITVEVSSVENLAPQRYALNGVRFIHPETKATMGRAAQVNIVSTQEQVHVTLTGTEIESRDLAAAWKITHDWFLCRPRLHSYPLLFSLDELAVRGLTQETRLTNIAMRLRPQADAMRLDVDFQLAPTAFQLQSRSNSIPTTPSPSKLTIHRNHQATRLSTVIELSTASPLPCPSVASLIPALGRLGGSATFTGYVQLEILEGSWNASLSKAEFQQVDFSQLTRNTSTAMTGTGALLVEKAQLEENRLHSMLITADVGPGRINNGFLQALGKHLDFDTREAGAGSVAVQTFDRAVASMNLDHEGLVIVGEIRDQLGSLASRSTDKWSRENTMQLERIIDVLTPNTSATRGDFAWLPVDRPVERTASQDSLSRTH